MKGTNSGETESITVRRDVKKTMKNIGVGLVVAGMIGVGAWGATAFYQGRQAEQAHLAAVAAAELVPDAPSVAPPAQDEAAATAIYDQQIAAQKAAQAAAVAAQQAAAAQAAQAAAAAAARDAVKTQPAPTVSTKLAAGSRVPWIPDSNPQDSAGGRWDTTACASGSASGNPAICD